MIIRYKFDFLCHSSLPLFYNILLSFDFSALLINCDDRTLSSDRFNQNGHLSWGVDLFNSMGDSVYIHHVRPREI